MIKAEIVADSVSTIGERITTMLVTFPRFILAELNTHRVFSKNSASSRAIPFKKTLKSVVSNPVIPIAFQKDHSGMQGTEYLDVDKIYGFEEVRSILHEFLSSSFKDEKGEWDEDWLEIDTILNTHVLPLLADESNRTIKAWWLKARDLVAAAACILYAMKVSKQICNRLLEPFMWHTVLITSTEWENFFALRCPQYSLFYENIPLSFRSKKDFLNHVHKVEAPEFKNQYDNLTELDWLKINKGQSEIHMMALAEAMWFTFNESKPKLLQDGEWHIPFEDKIEHRLDFDDYKSFVTHDEFIKTKVQISTGINARTSYTVVGEEGKEYSYKSDIKLHDKLLADRHMSPLEHCAQASPGRISRNFKGFKQYREILENSKLT